MARTQNVRATFRVPCKRLFHFCNHDTFFLTLLLAIRITQIL
jgi:hypothetical protein